MQLAEIKKLIALWDADKDNFRQKLSDDPVAACKGNGVNLEAGDDQDLKRATTKLPAQQLMVEIKIRP